MMAGSDKITTACDIEIAVDRDFLKWVSGKSLCPGQYRAVWGQRYGAVRLVEGRFFGFAQNDSCFARNDSCFARNDNFCALLRRPFLDTL